MRKQFDLVYQFKVTLKEVKPTVWRRIEEAETYNLWDLHVVILDPWGVNGFPHACHLADRS